MNEDFEKKLERLALALMVEAAGLVRVAEALETPLPDWVHALANGNTECPESVVDVALIEMAANEAEDALEDRLDAIDGGVE